MPSFAPALIRLTVSLFLLSISLGPQAQASENCPAVACDCQALPQVDWQKECERAELTLKNNCIANNNQPKGFCALHGPSATPLPLATQLSPVETTRDTAAIALLDQQLATALWSLGEDLSSLQKIMAQGNFINFSQVVKLFDDHVDEAFVLQQRIVGSRLAAGDTSRAENAASAYAKTLKPLAETGVKLGDSLWQQAAESPAEQRRYRQTLAQRLLRISGKLYEHQAFAYAAIHDASNAAKIWQDAARLDEHQLKLEVAGTNKAEYLSFYELQASARWNRASYYWASAKNTNKAQDAWHQAQNFEANVSADK